MANILILDAETVKSVCPDCADGDSETLTITGPLKTMPDGGAVVGGEVSESGGEEAPAAIEEGGEAPAKPEKSGMGPLAKAAMNRGKMGMEGE